MAINSTICEDHNQVYAANAMSSKVSNLAHSPLTAQSLISSNSANSNYKRRKSKNKSVYLCNNTIHLRSLIEDKSDKVLSSFQLAAKLYKSDSDEFKMTKKRSKKSNKKSVLTLPNEPALLPQSCTVSDMNDSEYFNHIHKLKAKKTKKRQPLQNKSPKLANYDYEYYDRDAAYCSQMNVYLDCSSVDVVKNFKGDGRRKRSNKSKTENEETSPSDVWAVLRNINRFQFYPSPPMSDDSSYEVKPRKKKAIKKKLNRGVYETCRTEQIAYFSNIDLNVSRSGSPSGSSQITVIDNQYELDKLAIRSYERNKPLVNAKNRRQDLPNSNSKRYRNTNTKFNSKKNSVSKDTLVDVDPKSELNSEQTMQTLNMCDRTLEETEGNNVCTSVEVQTQMEYEQKDLDTFRQCVTNSAAMGHGLPNRNLRTEHLDNKMHLRRLNPSCPSRVPWKSPQQCAKIQPERPLTNASSKVRPISPPGLTFSKLQDSPRVSNQATVDPMHPLTYAAIRKIVAKIKFPLIILGREQVSGTFEVEQYDYPQFGGLDEHVWPFMVDWIEKPKGFELRRPTASKKRDFKDTKAILPDVNFTMSDKKEQVGSTQNTFESKKNASAKMKPGSQFRDNIVKLLYKNVPNQNTVKDIHNGIQHDAKVNPAHIKSTNARSKIGKAIDITVSIDSITKPCGTRTAKLMKPRFSTTPPLPTSPSKILSSPKTCEPKKIWSKAKWASDFIENVIKKIKCGIYYSSDLHSNNFNTTPTSQRLQSSDASKSKLDSTEVSIQVAMPTVVEDFTPKVTIQKKKELTIKLPGFDDAVPQLEITSMTQNQIAVKPCVMNVLLQFDVNVPSEEDQGGVTLLKRSPSCVLLSVTDSKTKVFKCKTRLVNALLPAELCSIIPKVMRQFLDKKLQQAVPASTKALTLQEVQRNESLSTISEHAIYEIQEPIKLPLLPQIEMSPMLKLLRKGEFSTNRWTQKTNSNENIYIISIKELPYKYCNTEGLLSLHSSICPHDCRVHPTRELVINSTEPQSNSSNLAKSSYNSDTKFNSCTDLVLYTGNKVACCERTVQNTPLIALQEIFGRMLKWNTNTSLEHIPAIQVQACKNHIYVNFSLTDNQVIGASLCINTAHLKNLPIYNVTTKISSTSVVNYERPEKQIEYIKHAEIKDSNRTETRKPEPTVPILKSRKKPHIRYVKLYKKCKSTSHIVAERSSTPLSKVTNLDEFFQALGTGKQLSSVFDGNCGNKILTCISELKTFISAITPRQALLVMLLANKKDTSNLVKFRPLILQGIAVNRITRVSELDLEIEVIEKETFNKMTEYLDISSLIEIPQNNDHLLDELIWIAKTTASDYQRKFDETSEKLLKTLLEKRKRLNPSYLRVMARYVGLGLLKTPVNH